MTSTQRYLANSANLVARGALEASSVLPVADAVLSLPRARTGSALVSLAGLYAGHEEADYDVEITDTVVSVPLVSRPVFAGAGSGNLSNIAYTGAAQVFTVTLADLGRQLLAAGTDLEGASISARTPGAAGNAIRLHIDLSGLSYATTGYSLIRALPAGSDGVSGAEYDWDTKVMGADGIIPANAHRMIFGEDTGSVYVQYKQYKDAKWQYFFEPPIAQEIPAGTRIKFVSGGRTVTVTDGVVTETYPGIVTLYDLLAALQTGSALVKVAGVVANDRAPGGMAARDLQTRTDAHCLAPSYEGSASVRGALQGWSAAAASATELIEIKCWAATAKDHPNASLGRELWQVKGSVSGVLASSYRTGDLFSGGGIRFSLPVKLPDGYGAGNRGRFSVAGISYAPRGWVGEMEEPEAPPICVAAMALGPAATDQQLVLTYKKRPAGDCACAAMPAPDLSGKTCLTGTTSTGGHNVDNAQLARLSRLGAWHRDAVAANTKIATDGTAVSRGADIYLFDKTRDEFESCLNDLYTSGTLAWPAWAASAAIARYAIVQVGDARLVARNGGTTGATAPAIPASMGDTVADGTVTWEYLGATPELLWDDALDRARADLQILFGIEGDTIKTWVPAVPETPESWPGTHVSKLTAGAVLPAGTVLNNGVIAVTLGEAITVGSTAPVIDPLPAGGLTGSTISVTGATPSPVAATVLQTAPTPSAPGADGYYSDTPVADTGKDADTAYTWSSGSSGSGNSVPSSLEVKMFDYTPPIDRFLPRYISAMSAVRAAAGITKKADASTSAGDGCWRDTGAGYWWGITGSQGAYAPAFTNEPYFSSRDAGAGYFSTHEFAFRINVKCEDRLKEGDQITLSIGDAGWPSTYQVGDTVWLPVVSAQDLYLAGGSDGDNVQTWRVDGSVSGPLPSWAYDLDAPTDYNDAGLAMRLETGGIPFEAGDSFKFNIEGGHFRWRKDGGAWSPPSPLGGGGAGGEGLSDGLSLHLQTGAAPSFAAGDIYTFRALQPNAASHARAPAPDRWRWSGATAALTVDLGGAMPVDGAAIALHSLPETATITLSGSMDGIVWDWTETLPWRAGVIAALFPVKTAAWIKFTVTNAAGGSIGWAWAGEAVSTEFSGELMLSRDYRLARGAGQNPAAAWLGGTVSGALDWPLLLDDDMDKLLPMLDAMKQSGDEPMILIPNDTRPDEARLFRVNVDNIDHAEDGGYQPDIGRERRYTMKWDLKGVAG